MTRTVKVEEWRRPGTVALVERQDGMVQREMVLDIDEAEHLFFDGVKLCVELKRRERTTT